MRYLFVFAILLAGGIVKGQGSGFSFTYTGPTQILVGPDCEAELEWGHPNTPTVMSNIPGGFIVSFVIFSISGGYDIGDMIPGGTTVTVFYQATDNFGNQALFGFTIDFIDVLPPVFDASFRSKSKSAVRFWSSISRLTTANSPRTSSFF